MRIEDWVTKGKFLIKNKQSFEEEIKENKSLVDTFCKKYNVELQTISSTNENGFKEAMYYFSDELGGYTAKGVEDSLKE